MRRRIPTVSPGRFATLAWAALVMLTLVVLTGAAVRLTDSGLGCPDWPQCQGGIVAPLETHAWIEYGNRLFAALVGVVSLVVFAAALRRRPYRRDLMLLSATLPLGCLAQGGLGALTVATELAPELVMSHFALSMVMLIGAVALVWRARERPAEAVGKTTVWTTRLLLPVAAVTLLAGMVSTAAGPHAGDPDTVDRLDFRGPFTMEWAIEWHGYFAWALGLGAIAVWVLALVRREPRRLQLSLTAFCLLIGVQGVVGVLQYDLALPAELVWVHVTLATVTWVVALWCAAAAGAVAPLGSRVDADSDRHGLARPDRVGVGRPPG